MIREKMGTDILIPKSKIIDIKKYVSSAEYKFIRKVGKYADDFGINAYLVGGFVRDLFLGEKNIDLDITVEGNGMEYTRFLAKKLGATYKCFEKFKTGKIFLKNRRSIDITSARSEYYARPAALPDIKFTNLKYDLYRRDFTINAMAIQINKKKTGNFIDPFNGYGDLKNKIIRALHSRSFMDDPTRILRAIRFEKRFDFRIENRTLEMLKSALNKDVFNKVPGERLRDEVLLMMKEQKTMDILKRGQNLGMLQKIHKGVKVKNKTKKSLNRINFYVNKPVFKNIDLDCVYFMIFFNALNIKDTGQIIARLKFKNNWKNKIINAKKYERSILRRMKYKQNHKENLPALLCGFSREELFYFSLIYGKYFYELARRFLIKYKKIKLNVTGNDLKKIGIKQGPVYGKILKKIFYEKMSGKIKTKKQELKFVEKYLQGGWHGHI